MSTLHLSPSLPALLFALRKKTPLTKGQRAVTNLAATQLPRQCRLKEQESTCSSFVTQAVQLAHNGAKEFVRLETVSGFLLFCMAAHILCSGSLA